MSCSCEALAGESVQDFKVANKPVALWGSLPQLIPCDRDPRSSDGPRKIFLCQTESLTEFSPHGRQRQGSALPCFLTRFAKGFSQGVHMQ